MVEKRLELEHEVHEVFELIDENKNFLLSGGAGSGKTYSLVQVIKQIILENPTSKIACMTYTNAAVKEIEERVNNKNLYVSTIHDFLWDNIKHFQKELKKSLVLLVNNEEENLFKISDQSTICDDYFDSLKDGIQYKEFVRLKDGIISHDQVIIIADKLFEHYKKLCDIIIDKYPFILIDEYQDTQEQVVKILLTHLSKSEKQNVIGFFGDSMQSIYPNGVGDLNNFLDKISEVQKEQNRRNPQKIMDLANILRTDGIHQIPSQDRSAPNIRDDGSVKEGSINFIYSSNENLENVRRFLDWDFNNPRITKELNLTHNLIADKGNFRALMDIYDKDQILAYRNRIKKYIKENGITTDFSNMIFGDVIAFLKNGKTGNELNKVKPTAGMQLFIDQNIDLFDYAKNYNYKEFSSIYVDKEQLLDDKKQDEDEINKKGSQRDNLIKHLFKIQNAVYLYQNKKFNEFIRVTDYRSKLISIEQKRILKQNIDKLTNVGEKTIEEVIKDADDKGICLIDDNLNRFKLDKKYVYDRVKKVKFSEFQELYKYLEGFTPFSTQHKTKGAEFENVLVVLDNGGWSSYNFNNLFLDIGTASVLERTKKIFYVCCTRSKENLAVFYHNPDSAVINKAKLWFGEENVINLDDISS